MDSGCSTRSMGSNGTSHFRGISDDEEMRCKCSFRMVMQICKKEPNRGRRFIQCPIRGDDSCLFFTWCDPELYTDSMEVVGMLLRKIDDYERDIQTCKQRVEWVTKVAIVGYVATLLCIVIMLSGM